MNPSRRSASGLDLGVGQHAAITDDHGVLDPEALGPRGAAAGTVAGSPVLPGCTLDRDRPPVGRADQPVVDLQLPLPSRE